MSAKGFFPETTAAINGRFSYGVQFQDLNILVALPQINPTNWQSPIMKKLKANFV